MAVPWIVCAVCEKQKRGEYGQVHKNGRVNTDMSFGEHLNGDGEQCPGSDQPPGKGWWGNSEGISVAELGKLPPDMRRGPMLGP